LINKILFKLSGFRSINKNKAFLKSKKSKFLDPTKGYLSK